MTRKSLIFLTAIIMSWSLPALAKKTTSQTNKPAYLSTGLSLNFSDKSELLNMGFLWQYGTSLSRKKSFSLGLALHTSEDNMFFGFQANCETQFLTKGKFNSGLEGFFNIGAVGQDGSTKLGMGFGAGAFTRYLISERRTTVFRVGLKFFPQAIDNLSLQSAGLSAYMGMNFQFHL